MRSVLFLAALLAIGGTVKADTFVNGERYEAGQPVAQAADIQYVSAAACSQAQASACSSPQSAAACGASASARTGPVRRLFGKVFRGRLRGCG